MTPDELRQLKAFEANVRRLLMLHRQQQEQIVSLQRNCAALQTELDHLRQSLAQAQQENQRLRTAQLLLAAEGDIAQARGRIAKLTREVNKCITILSTGEITV